MIKKRIAASLQRSWFIWVWIVLWISALFCNYSALDSGMQWIVLLGICVFLAAVVWTIGDWKGNREETIILILMAGSILLRMAYCMHVPYNRSPHDLGMAREAGSLWYADGHIGYVQQLYQYGCLPKCDPRTVWCYYNPPFYYIVAAAFLKVNYAFGLDMRHMLENLQMLTMLFATVSIEAGYRVLKEFRIKGSALYISFAILAFHPYFIIGGATLNNDMLSILFMFLAFLYVIRWYKAPRFTTICKVALCIGLGMMTKVSVGLIAIPVGLLFLVKFCKEKQYKTYLKQFALFGIICIPLGMYWSIRNAVLYKMPLVYVQSMGENNLQYISMDFVKRINPLDISNLFDPFVRIKPKTDYNIWTVLCKTAVFDEFKGELSNVVLVIVSRVLLYSSILLAIMALVCGISNCIRKNKKIGWMDGIAALTYVIFIGSYLKFCAQFPVVCSMNFRYVVPTLLIGTISIGEYLQDEERGVYGKGMITGCAVVFTAYSILLYGVLRFN